MYITGFKLICAFGSSDQKNVVLGGRTVEPLVCLAHVVDNLNQVSPQA